MKTTIGADGRIMVSKSEFREACDRITSRIIDTLPHLMTIQTSAGGSSRPRAYWLVGPEDVPDAWASIWVQLNTGFTKDTWEIWLEWSASDPSDFGINDLPALIATVQLLPKMAEIIKEELGIE